MRRRDFFAVMGGGIVVLLEEDLYAQETGGPRRGAGGAVPAEIGAWLHIGESGDITVYTGKVEVGQNARTSLTQAVVEELHAPVSSRAHGDGRHRPYPVRYRDGGQHDDAAHVAANSQSRGGGARNAARPGGAEVERGPRDAEGRGRQGFGGRAFGGLRRTDARRTADADDSGERGAGAGWRMEGRGDSLPKVNGHAIVTGAHKYTYDLKRQGMLYARCSIRRSSARRWHRWMRRRRRRCRESRWCTRATSWRWRRRSRISRPRPWRALKAEWKPVTAEADSRTVFQYFKKTAQGGAAQRANLTPYTIAYIAHVPLEPRSALAQWEGDKLTVWTGSQRPFGVRSELAQAFRVAEEQVRVIVPDTGSGYGGKHNGDAAVEAARIAKAAGKPVKRNWTREEEMTWAYFRPGGAIEVAGKAAAGRNDHGVGVPQLQFGAIGTAIPVRDCGQEGAVPPVEIAAAAGIVPRPGGDGQSLRARVLHGRTGGVGEDGSAGVPSEEREGRAAARCDPGGLGQVRLEGAEEDCRARVRHRGGLREGRLCGDLRRSQCGR